MWTASKISSLLSIFVSDKYIMFLFFHAYILKLSFEVILVGLDFGHCALYIVWSMLKMSHSFDKQQRFNDFSVKHDLYKPLLASYTQSRVAAQLKSDFWTGFNVFAEKIRKKTYKIWRDLTSYLHFYGSCRQ